MSSKKFSHRFSGLSIWLEPDPEQSSQLIEEMEFLRCKCGGIDAGLHRFVPHCTLLYNTSLDNYSGDEDTKTTWQQQGESMLRSCIHEFHRLASTINKTSSSSSNTVIQLIPTSQYYFPYPKTADNGKGFGCCISLLILETTPHLQLLHDIVRDRFPPDERHRKDCSGETNQEEEDGNESRFRPHMALVYAPQDHENVTSGWLERYTTQNEAEKRYMKWINVKKEDPEVDDDCNNNQSRVSCSGWDAKYISLWSTEGTLDEWYPIVKLDLGKAL
jgi:2'-5' RNA ligase